MPRTVNQKDLGLLKRCAVRQNWSKVTLFNLTQLKRQRTIGRTFYQQKFKAKQETRRYHGEALTKRQWQNIFRPSLRSVVGMNTKELAMTDGSQHAEGRGAGLKIEVSPGEKVKEVPMIPYMLQTYAPMERRLDMAIFRSMFASSALQARQFVIHGFVKVNGKKMQYPQYMLNPGDMFSVDIDKVLFATGVPKKSSKFLSRRQARKEAKESKSEDSTETATEAAESTEAGDATVNAVAEKLGETTLEDAPESARELNKEREMARDGRDWQKDANLPETMDRTKPYATPWKPRSYISAFAFIPKYLEVNHNTGHAVYLRHPVARPGQSEVPTPFDTERMQLAYAWFLRRR